MVKGYCSQVVCPYLLYNFLKFCMLCEFLDPSPLLREILLQFLFLPMIFGNCCNFVMFVVLSSHFFP